MIMNVKQTQKWMSKSVSFFVVEVESPTMAMQFIVKFHEKKCTNLNKPFVPMGAVTAKNCFCTANTSEMYSKNVFHLAKWTWFCNIMNDKKACLLTKMHIIKWKHTYD